MTLIKLVKVQTVWCFEVSPTHYCSSTGDVFYLIPFKKKLHIPGIPIDVVAVNLLFFAISI
jgi:hypothetical protein